MKRSGRRADLAIGVALLLFCGAVFWRTATFPEVPAMLSQNVPPTFFPRLVLGVIVALTLLLLVRGETREKGDATFRASVLVTAVSMIATVAILPRLGTFTTIALASIGFPLLWGERRALRIGLLAIGLPLAIYAIFVAALGMRFPQGALP